MTSALITSDLHLTAKPEEAYRWQIFEWLRQQQQKRNVEELWILGDITDAKDNHSSALTNALVHEITKLANQFSAVRVLMGNHDYIDPSNPFFKFLSTYPSVHFYVYPSTFRLGGKSIRALPHTRDPHKTWEDEDFNSYSLILIHQTVEGSRASNGPPMEGIHADFFNGAKVLSGDIHVPQDVGSVKYVGSPYHVTFGDSFKPRCLLYEKGKIKSLPYPWNVGRHSVTLRKPDQLYNMDGLNQGDHIKIKLKLPRNELVAWEEHKRRTQAICSELGIQLHGIALEQITKRLKSHSATEGDTAAHAPTRNMAQVFKDYCKEQNIKDSTFKELGLEILDTSGE